VKKIISLRWVILAVWIVGLAVLMISSPNMNQLVREKGGYSFPDNYSSSIAGNLEKKVHPGSNGTTYLAAFHSAKGLTAEDMNAIGKTLQKVKDHKIELHIASVTDSFDNSSLKNQLISKNNQTLIAMLQIQNNKNLSVHQVRTAINSEIRTNGVKTYLTGQQLINDDMSTTAQEGLKKTEWITIIFILVVLLLVFRSAIAPLIPLINVGISYLVAQAVVAFLVDYFNFPISDFTQIFMVAIMFGIGTDYCILLLSRFKEEMANGNDKYQATLNMFKTAGITVLHSGIPVFIAFLSLAFVQFSLYRSAVAVGVGVIFLLLALFTLLPLFTVTLGDKLFWPMNKKITQSKSGLWASAGNLAFSKPIIALLIVALFTVPPIIAYHNQISFNSPEDIPDKYPSKAGFNLVSRDFGAGNISPATIYFQNDENMRTTDYVALMEQLSSQLASDPNVSKVLSVSRPVGKRLDDIYIRNQAGTVHDGLLKAADGTGKLQKSLSDTGNKIKSSQPQLSAAGTSVDRLQAGTRKTSSGIDKMSAALTKISSGIKTGSAGTSAIRKNIRDAQDQLAQLQSGQLQIQNGYQQVAANLHTISAQLSQFSTPAGRQAIDTTQLQQTLGQMGYHLKAYLTTHPEAMNDPNFAALAAEIQQLPGMMQNLQRTIQTTIDKQTQSAQTKIRQLNSGIRSLADVMDQLNSQSQKVTDGLDQFQTGITQLDTGLGKLNAGLNQAATGQDQVIASTPQLTAALDQIAGGQQQMKTGFSKVQSQMGALSDGLTSGAKGAGQIQTGIQSAGSFINNWTKLSYNDSGIYVPESIFSNSGFKKSLNQYISQNGKVASISVISKDDPYSNQGIRNFQAMNDRLPTLLRGTPLENAHIGISGIASTNSDIQKMESSDYTRAVTFVLIGVFIALVIVLRSLTMPVYLMASLLLTYFSSLGFSELVFTKVFHYSGLTWTTPFFSFIILMALGIDYSIFVMTRFNEYASVAIRKRMILTLWHMGNVIFSAVIILSGTFAAMIPSGMLSLVEIATTAIIGLILYAVIVIPLFVPVMVKFFGRGNWWPFSNKKSDTLDTGETRSV
jgi:Predicted drug exporters of the RND superfamily